MLLSLCGKNDYRNAIQSVQEAEFSTVSGYMVTHHDQVNWEHKINVLMAASLKVLGMSDKDAQPTMMCKSHLLRIDNGIPIPYFPTIRDDFLSSQIKTLFSNMNPVKTDANSVIGNFFEARLPSLISLNDYQLTLEVKQLTNDKIVTMLKPLQGSANARLEDLILPPPSNDTVWRTPIGYKAIDFIVKTKAPIEGILAVQATVQAKNQREKIRKSMIGLNSDIVAEDIPLIFVLINPLWTDFDTNHKMSFQVVRHGQDEKKLKIFGMDNPAISTIIHFTHEIMYMPFKVSTVVHKAENRRSNQIHTCRELTSYRRSVTRCR